MTLNNSLPNYQFDAEFYQVMTTTHPELLETIRQLVNRGESPVKIGQQVMKQTGNCSVLPGLCEGAARHLERLSRTSKKNPTP